MKNDTYITNHVLIVLVAICLALVGVDFFRDRHGHFPIENLPLMFCFFGFVIYGTLIFLAKGLRLLIERPENYYGNQSIDAEPEVGLGPDAPEKIEVRHD
jgi:TRAP-type C4-dicarboxylate transport system permease small subunit